MPLAPVIGAALALGLPTRTKALWIDGVDVMGGGGRSYGTLADTIELVERSAGQVSTLTFQVDDPLNAITLTKSARVLFMDITRNVPLFTGFVDRYPYTRRGLGRVYDVSCVGIESVLDWIKVPPITFAALSDGYGAIATAVAAGTGVGVSLNIAWDLTGTSSRAFPFTITTPTAPMTALAFTGGTLREAISQIIEACNDYLITTVGIVGGDWRVTVDPYGGLRCYDLTAEWAADSPSDWALLTIAGAARYPSGTTLETTGVQVRGVYIAGGNAAGSGVVMDGSGLPGEVAYLTDAAITTDSAKRASAQRYLAANGPQVSGTLELEENTTVGSVGNEVRAGGKVRITDANMGLTAFDARSSEISKAFLENGAEVWRLSFGTPPASGAEYLRQLTRAVQG